ncbi:MAG: hypothetical protein V8R51_08560 [Clostridia bacterium]
MRNSIKIIISIILSIIIIAIITNIIIYNKKDGNKIPESNTYVSEVIEDECTEEYINEQNTTTVVSTEEKVAANAILILKKYYTKCEHTVNEYVELPQELVNMTKKDVEAYYSDWKVIGFEQGKITLYKEFDDTCGEHFKLKIEDGKVVVYIVNKDGTESIYEKTSIPSEYLTETDLINMQNGLEIYGEEELNQIIEDFE